MSILVNAFAQLEGALRWWIKPFPAMPEQKKWESFLLTLVKYLCVPAQVWETTWDSTLERASVKCVCFAAPWGKARVTPFWGTDAIPGWKQKSIQGGPLNIRLGKGKEDSHDQICCQSCSYTFVFDFHFRFWLRSFLDFSWLQPLLIMWVQVNNFHMNACSFYVPCFMKSPWFFLYHFEGKELKSSQRDETLKTPDDRCQMQQWFMESLKRVLMATAQCQCPDSESVWKYWADCWLLGGGTELLL